MRDGQTTTEPRPGTHTATTGGGHGSTRAGRRPNRLPGTAALALAGALVLAGCGSGEDAAEGGERAVETVNGTVKVPEKPQRVVVLDTAELDSALTLGVTPVGAVTAQPGKPFLSYLPKDRLKDVENVGVIAQPNLEKVAELKPDLILTNQERDGQRYDELKQIAPTVMTKTTGYPWKENFQVHAEALGKKPEARKALATYRDRAAAVTKALGGKEKARKIETSVIRFQEGADTRIYGEKAYIATLLKDVGLGRPDVVKEATDYDGLALDVSPEQVDKGDADVVFYTSYGSPTKSGERKAVKSPLWKGMNAVRKDRAFHVQDELWIQGIGYTAAGKILQEMRGHLTS
ncbi:iron-siderophore ABC transporter substrate-binding protein [Streptomyces sp. AJS327]|uniref:ABC transporter substrate-binding protein n=1 Tax=Streptomyces sp. AJS327 TaxID=2545265 RepID=UPI0015DF3502|nr:iron-siderophore ABC transporter substrate-binding protein [Streptomyces sp. AJS327]MBA0053144.1 iron-siderophore ABC transporter substrate-binding protein [Streptomyces sp. AJS327]